MWSGGSILRLAEQPARFALVGIANSLAGLTIIYLCKLVMGLGDVPANMAGYAFGVILSFALNASWTFQYRGAVLPAALRFAAVFAIAYGTNLAVVLLLIDAWAVNGYVAQAIGILPYTLAFYVLSKAVVFRS